MRAKLQILALVFGYYAVFLVIGAYFAVSAVQGENGRFARTLMIDEETRLVAEYSRLQEEVGKMENLVRRLSDNYLDLDLLDERAREALSFAHDDDIIVTAVAN